MSSPLNHKNTVHKFGGSSLASAERFSAVAAIVAKEPEAWVVVSAPGDTTDELLALIDSREQPELFAALLQQLTEKLGLLIQRTLNEQNAAVLISKVQSWFAEVPGFFSHGSV